MKIRNVLRFIGHAALIPPAAFAGTMFVAGVMFGTTTFLAVEVIEYATSTPDERKNWHNRGR